MARQRVNTQPKDDGLDHTVSPLPQEDQPDPHKGWEGREPFKFKDE